MQIGNSKQAQVDITELIRTTWHRRADGNYGGLTPSGVSVTISGRELDFLSLVTAREDE